MQQQPNFNGTLAAPGKVCVIRRAMRGAPDANAQWEHFRDYWLKTLGLDPGSVRAQHVRTRSRARSGCSNGGRQRRLSHNGAHRGSH
jgi:hypothetical protein